MKWRLLYWLFVLVVAVVIVTTVPVLLPEAPDGLDFKYAPHPKGCTARINTGVGLLVSMAGLFLLAWWVQPNAGWVWRKWPQHKRNSR